ncbi:MAG: hypothetical protein WBW74_12730 [Xanthobacteraceae bacterium]
MKNSLMKYGAGLGRWKHVAAVVVALLLAGAIGGWGVPMTFATRATATEPPYEAELKTSLVGSYRVTGTDSDGMPYAGRHIVDISLAPSGALEFAWDDGRTVGVGQIVGNVLAVASLNKNRTAILTMTINSDGSLAGKWSRRTDRGTRGTEVWVKK